MQTGEDVLVIGTGPAGLASAYSLQQAGIAYRVVDKADVIASTWARQYPSLRLNTTRFFSHLPGQKFPLSYGIFATAKQYHTYLVNYARRHNFNIHLGVEVTRLSPENGGWRVESSEGVAWYPAVIVAAGRYDNPIMPAIPGLADFKGTLIHAHEYRGPEPFANKRVMVVGNGPTGVDIAVELPSVTPHPVLLSMRTGLVLKPRYPYGLPKHAWVMIAERLPKRMGAWLDKRVEAAKYKNLAQIGIKQPPEGQVSGAAATRGPELVRAVKAGKVKPVDGPARFYDRCVELTDGSRHEIDVLILATGYRPTLYKFLDCAGSAEIGRHGWPMRKSGDEDLNPDREVKGCPGLYLVGTFYQGKGALYNFNVEAEWAVEQIRERLSERR